MVLMSLMVAFPSVQALDPLSRKKLCSTRTYLSVQPPSHRRPQSYRMCLSRVISVPYPGVVGSFRTLDGVTGFGLS